MYNSSVCANVFNIKNRITIKFINSIIHIAKVIKFLYLWRIKAAEATVSLHHPKIEEYINF